MTGIFASSALLPGGWADDVRVTVGGGGHIEGVDKGAAPRPDDRRVAVLLPALANLHSHTFQRGMAGLAEARGPAGRDSFWTWREVMYRFLDILSPEEIEAIAAFAFLEMQEAGFASVAEFHYLHNRPGGGAYDDQAELSSRILAAARETGIGLTLLPVAYAQGGVDGRPLAGGQLRFRNDLDGFARLLEAAERHATSAAPDTSVGVAPHSLRAVGAEALREIAALRPDAPLHMHIAEQEQEVEETIAAFGRRPVEWLFANHAVDARWCLIHSTHMTPEETGLLAASGAVAGLCPVTEANLGDGIFDGARHLGSGGTIGVGTDSNILISVQAELRQLEYSQRLRDRLRVVLAGPGRSSGRVLLDAALAGGARALGRATGAIEAGRWADLVALDPGLALLGHLSGDALLDGWVFAAPCPAVTDLWSGGRHAVRDGRHVAREAISARYAATMKSIMARL